MKKQVVIKRQQLFLILGMAAVIAILILPAVIARADTLNSAGQQLRSLASEDPPTEMVQRAWQNAQKAGSYRFLSDVDQTLVPRALPEMIGQQDTALHLALDGAVVLPEQAYIELRVVGVGRSQSATLLRDDGQSFMLQGGELKPVEDILNLANQTNDILGYLAAAEQVVLLDSPEGHPELARYAFVVSGPRFAEYVRQQAEAELQAEPGAPAGLNLQPLPSLQSMSGQGELWVDSAGLPVRQLLDLEMPEVNRQYGARIRMRVDLSGFGQVEALPKAVKGADGAWRLEGNLPAPAGRIPFVDADMPLGPAMAAADESAQPAADPAAVATDAGASENALTTLLSRLASPVHRVAPSSLTLFILALLTAVMLRTYRRNRQLCYALIVLTLIPIMLVSPLLQAEGVLRFQERRAEAAETRAAAVPEMLGALGLETTTAASDTTEQATTVEDLTLPTVTTEMLQAPENGGALRRCGEGEPGVDTDGDGLADTLELCLGTDPDSVDSDYDAISDKEELDGFDLGGKHWDSDPLGTDSNHDGLADTREWASALNENGAEHGEAFNADVDGDLIPNLWDEDDDGDGVPDGQDLSPFALTDYTAALDLSTGGQMATGGIQTIEIAIQPEDNSHLRYSTTALDWPDDELGNVQDLDHSTADLRLTPFLLVTTNVAPDTTLAAKYGFSSWVDDQGQTTVMAPLQPLEENGAVYSFYGKVAYTAAQVDDIQWQAKLVWMVQMQHDYWFQSGGYQTNRMVTETRLLHQYEEPFRVTGLHVTRSEGAEAALFGTPSEKDDRYLFQLFMGLGDTFLAYEKLEGQGENETALDELYGRFSNADTITHTFGIEDDIVAMSQPAEYGNGDAAIAGVGSEMLPGFFADNPIYSQRLYYDADGNPVKSATLLLATEQSQGFYDLGDFKRTGDETPIADLSQMHVNLADIAVLTTRSVNLRMYEADLNNQWQLITPSRMLELINARYAGVYASTLATLDPNLEARHAQFIAVTGYLWAYGGILASLAVDGQTLLPELPDEDALALRHDIENALEGNSINYLALATGIVGGLKDSFGWGKDIFEVIQIPLDWNKLIGQGKLGSTAALAGLALAASTASIVMGALNTACKTNPELPMCQNETAWFIADVAVKELAFVAQVVSSTVTITKFALHTLKGLDSVGKITGAIGLVIGIAATWITFAFTVWLTWGDPIAWRVGLASAIVSTVWMIVMFALNFIPVIGQLITAILSLIDAIISFFTWLFGAGDWNIAQAIVKLFYDAEATSSLKAAEFGEFESGLEDPDMGLIAGNVFNLQVPATGVIQKENDGKDKDLNLSYVAGDLNPQQSVSGLRVQRKSTLPECQIVDDELHCSNVAALGYLLRPAINGAASFAARILYQTAWAEYGFYGTVRYKTHTTAGVLPEDGGETTTLYMDVLPATLSEVWTWAPLGNDDSDGDGLSVAQEQALGTQWAQWDSDGDGLSDSYEWQNPSAPGVLPGLKDTDLDGLDDGLELRLGTRPNVADSDGDGLSDGEEVRRYDADTGAMVGGWEATMPSGETFWVSSDPLAVDDDGDGLNASEEKTNRLSPNALNALVPGLSLRANPVIEIPDARQGIYWEPNTPVSFTIELANVAYAPVTTTLSLKLPYWLHEVSDGVLQGDRTISPARTGTGLSWDFSGANALQLYEVVSTTVTALVDPLVASAHDEISLELQYGQTEMRKPIQATVDGDDPLVAIVAPLDGAYLRGTSYVVGGAAIDRTTWVTEVGLSIVEQGSEASFETLSGSKSPWAYSWAFPMTDNVYTLQAQAVDAMGHITTTQEVSVTVDNTPPQVTLNSTMVAGTVHLSGTATDNLAGVQWLQLAIDGQPWRSVPLSGVNWSYDWTVGEGSQGDHEVLVRAIDRSRNESAVLSDTITVDSVAPSSIVNRGADLDVPPAVAANSTFTLTGVADEGGHLPLPAVAADFRTGMDVFDDSSLWLGLSSVHDNDGGVLATWIGDFNANRLADLAVGLPGPAGDAGQVTVLYGRAGGWPSAPDLEMLAESRTHFNGAAGARLGSYLAAAGDANGDNYADLLIGERNSTRAFLIFGNPGPLGNVALEAGQTGYRTLLQAPANANIQGLAAAGDADGDGLEDILITAGGTAYLLLGRGNPWPETVDVATEAVKSWASVTGALGVGDVDNDQRSEWVTTAANEIVLYSWNSTGTSLSTTDVAPRAGALGDVDDDGKADWLYADGDSRTLVYGSGATPHTFSGYGGFFAAPGDVDGDGRPDILLSDTAGTASLIGQQASRSSPQVFATIKGVGGAANAPYAAGSDLNADGSAEVLLIPGQTEAEARGFDAPDFSSGFISPHSLPVGVSSPFLESEPAVTGASETVLSLEGARSFDMLEATILQADVSDTFYVDDDSGGCDGNSTCYQTIQAAVDAADGGGDTIIVYPGVYASFRVPSGADYDYLTVKGVNADAIFVEGNTGDAIQIAAKGVHLSNLTVRNAASGSGVLLESGAGALPLGSGDETAIDHLVVHSVRNPISIDQAAALTLTNSTLVGTGANPILQVGSTPNSAVHTWNSDQNLGTLKQPPGANAGLVGAGGNLYAVRGGMDRTVYAATPGSNGALSSWTNAFQLPHHPTSTSNTSVLAAGGDYFYQVHPDIAPDLGATDGEIHAIAVAPNGDIYVGGHFTEIGGVTALNIARWDGAAWHALGNGLSHTAGTGIVYAITILDNNNIFVGGNFNRANASTYAYNIARWDGTNWNPLGPNIANSNGTDGPVYALAHSTDGYVFVGGSFSSCPGAGSWVVAKNFAMWKNSANAWWNAMANGVDDPIRSLVWDGTIVEIGSEQDWLEGYPPAGKLYAGGDFLNVDNEYNELNVDGNFPVSANHVAYWHVELWAFVGNHRSAWVAMGSGVSNPVVDLALDQTTTTHKLYAAAQTASSYEPLPYWDGASWSTVAPSVSGGYAAVAVDALGNVYAARSGSPYQIYTSAADSTDNMIVMATETTKVWDLVADAPGQVLAAFGDSDLVPATGGIGYRAMASLNRRDLSSGTWDLIRYPVGMDRTKTPLLAADDAGNLYSTWNEISEDYSVQRAHLYTLAADSTTWQQRAQIGSGNYHIFGKLVWAGSYLYALSGYKDKGGSDDLSNFSYIFRYDPTLNQWSSFPIDSIDYQAIGSDDAFNLVSAVGDDAGHMYTLAPSNWVLSRYDETGGWIPLTKPEILDTSQPSIMTRVGDYLYAYAT
ncbi:MAG: hypothetical protein RRC07_07000, partial [Anaerolineae bacterium]|nr:hypothetical protein [Anaerolineae bacterium]